MGRAKNSARPGSCYSVSLVHAGLSRSVRMACPGRPETRRQIFATILIVAISNVRLKSGADVPLEIEESWARRDLRLTNPGLSPALQSNPFYLDVREGRLLCYPQLL